MNLPWTKMSVRIAPRSKTVAQVAVELGATPSRSVEAGQLVSPRSSAFHRQSFCIYDSPLSSENPPGDHVSWALEFLKSVDERIEAAGSTLEIDIRLSISCAAGQMTMAITPEESSFLGSLGVQFNIDLYPTHNNSEDEAG